MKIVGQERKVQRVLNFKMKEFLVFSISKIFQNKK
jgi:hypothetical protein